MSVAVVRAVAVAAAAVMARAELKSVMEVVANPAGWSTSQLLPRLKNSATVATTVRMAMLIGVLLALMVAPMAESQIRIMEKW